MANQALRFAVTQHAEIGIFPLTIKSHCMRNVTATLLRDLLITPIRSLMSQTHPRYAGQRICVCLTHIRAEESGGMRGKEEGGRVGSQSPRAAKRGPGAPQSWVLELERPVIRLLPFIARMECTKQHKEH